MGEKIRHHQRVAFVLIGKEQIAKHVAAVGFQLGLGFIEEAQRVTSAFMARFEDKMHRRRVAAPERPLKSL